MFKKLFIFSFIVLSTCNTFAQKERILNLPDFDKHRFHYGFYLGVNRNDFKIAYNAGEPGGITNPNVIVEPSIGFNVGLIGDMKLHKNVNLRFEPGLISNTKVVTFDHVSGTEADRVREEVGNTYLHLPVILKFSTYRYNNIRPYVLGGVSYDYNFSSNEANNNDNSSGEFRQKSSAFMYEVGIGVDFYLPFFKFSPSIRGIFALSDELVRDNVSPSQWTDPINYMGTRGVFLHLAFE